MQKPLVSLGVLILALQACSGKPAGFQGDSVTVGGADTATGDATGRSVGNRDSASGDAIAKSNSAADAMEQQSVETDAIEMDTITVFQGSDATVSIPANSDAGSNSDTTNSTSSDDASTTNSKTSASTSNGMDGSSDTTGSNTSSTTMDTGTSSTVSTAADAGGAVVTTSAGTSNDNTTTMSTASTDTNTTTSNTDTNTTTASTASTDTSSNTTTTTSDTNTTTASTASMDTSSNTTTTTTPDTNTTTTSTASMDTSSNTTTTPAPLTLTISVPSTSLRAGSSPMQATVALSGQTAAPHVIWSIKTDAGQNAGSIDQNGLYTPPAMSGGYDVTISAVLADDSSVAASVTIKIVTAGQIFVGCQQGSTYFPITADVYQLPVNTKQLPVFSTLAQKATTVCMDQYNVAPRDWSSGFPGVTGLYEWFALHTSTHLVAPTDGTYTFKLNSDDGAKLYIDGVLIINNDGQHAPTAKEGSVYLSAGEHALTIDYFQGPRYQIALELYWKTPGISTYSYVPKDMFK